VKTITWFHTGAAVDRDRVLSQFAHEYFGGFAEKPAPAEPELHDLRHRGVARGPARLQGHAVAPGVYELDVESLAQGVQRPVKLFSVACHNADIRRIQPRADQRHAVFLVTESEALTYQHELDLPR
jgi:hypothetical protein